MKLASRMSILGTETAFETLAKARALEAQGQAIIHLEIGEPDFDTPDHVREAGKKAIDEGFTHYGPSAGLPEARIAVADFVSERMGYTVNPDNIVVATGGKPIMFYTMLALIEEGDEVIYPNPGFPIYESVINFSGAKAVPMALHEETGFSFSAEEVLELVTPNTRLLILNSPANPTGGAVPKEEMDKLVAGLNNHPHVVVLSDEIYDRMLYDGREHVSLLSYESIRERLVLLNGWSKTYAMTGWRMGYGVWPADLIEPAKRLSINCHSCVNAAAQWAGIAALEGPQNDVDKMVAAFDDRRRVIVRALNQVPGFSCTEPGGAFYAFPNISKTGVNAHNLQNKLLNEAGVAVIAGTSFGAYGEGYLRFSYANSTENIECGIERIRACLSNA